LKEASERDQWRQWKDEEEMKKKIQEQDLFIQKLKEID
jgi:hypothetical protein